MKFEMKIKENHQIFCIEIPLGDDVHHDLTNVLNQLPVDAFNDLFQGKINFFPFKTKPTTKNYYKTKENNNKLSQERKETVTTTAIVHNNLRKRELEKKTCKNLNSMNTKQIRKSETLKINLFLFFVLKHQL